MKNICPKELAILITQYHKNAGLTDKELDILIEGVTFLSDFFVATKVVSMYQYYDTLLRELISIKEARKDVWQAAKTFDSFKSPVKKRV